jgi:hypothetical protein
MMLKQQLEFYYALIDQVCRGKVTSEEAKGSATKQSLGPIATTPDPLSFPSVVRVGGCRAR